MWPLSSALEDELGFGRGRSWEEFRLEPGPVGQSRASQNRPCRVGEQVAALTWSWGRRQVVEGLPCSVGLHSGPSFPRCC